MSLQTVVLHYCTFGPYHVARFDAAKAALRENGIRLIGLMTCSNLETYSWEREISSQNSDYRNAFPNQPYGEIGLPKMFQGVFQELSKLKPDVVVTMGYNYPDSWAAITWCKLNRKPIILMSESKEDDSIRTGWKESLKKQVVKRFDAALCAGTSHKAYLVELGIPAQRIFLGHSVVNNNYFTDKANAARNNPKKWSHLTGLDDLRPYFLASARFIARKNLDGLLSAYATYRNQFVPNGTNHEPWRLIILGDGALRDELEQQIADHNIQDVVMPGFRQIDELPAYYAFASAFIHPPHQEQWGLVVNEAMAAGLPTVVSKQCGCRFDLVEEGLTGYSFDSTDLSALTNIMLKLSSESVDLEQLGKNALAKVEAWGPKKFGSGLNNAVHAAVGED